MNVTDPLINPHWFLFLSAIVKDSMITRSSVVEIQNLVWIQNHDPFSWSLNNLYLSTFSANLNFDKILQNERKTLLWSHFLQRKFFLKTLAKCNCSGPPSFRCQNTKQIGQAIKPKIIPSLSACKNHWINMLNSSIIKFVRYTWF